MKSIREYLTFNTRKSIEFINITRQVEQIVKKSGVEEGLCLVNAMHITASLFINDEERGLKEDFRIWLEGLAPEDIERYRHNLTKHLFRFFIYTYMIPKRFTHLLNTIKPN